MNQRKTFYNWLTTKYLIIVRDEESFEEKRSFRVTMSKIVVLLAVVSIVIGTIGTFVTSTVIGKWLDPRNEMVSYDKRLVDLSMKVDSLEEAALLKDQFITSLKGVFSGELSVEDLPKKVTSDSLSSVVTNLEKIQPVDSVFRKEFEEDDYDWLEKRNATKNELQEVFFFSPLTGIVSKKYDPKEPHYGVDVVAKKDEPIKAIADGTVIMASWTQDSGYVIGIQHKNKLISFYKHNSTLLKQSGELVRAGDIISIIGNSGEYTDGPHLHLELWYEGNPVDPEDFVSF